MIENIDYHVTDKCNLNCISCGHFCPLVPKDTQHKSLDQIHNDLFILKRAIDNGLQVGQVTLTGGELTLHPDLEKVIHIAGSLFKGMLKIWTNGIRYKTLVDLKDVINKYNIQICITNYNQPFSARAIDSLRGHFPTVYVDRSNGKTTAIFNKQFFSEDRCTEEHIVRNCASRKYCLQLVDGILYPCQYLAYIHYFEDKFKGQYNLDIPEVRGFNLKNDLNPIHIQEFVDNYFEEICLHCMDYANDRPIQIWKQSEGNIDEWYARS